MTGLLCLIEYNEIFNKELPQTRNQFFDEKEDGLVCHCMPECSKVDYSLEINPIYDEPPISDEYVLLDIHYVKDTMVKYRTDVTFSSMDLVVGFGGIVSLFLGCSLISGVEILYFTTVALFWNRLRSRNAFIGKIKAKFPFLH